MYIECFKHRNWKTMLMLLTTLVMLLLIGCGCWEPDAPERSFTPQDLLIDQSMVPPEWELTDPSFPTGDNLVTSESATLGFKVTISDTEDSILGGGHDVYRHSRVGIARRTFEKVYLTAFRLQTELNDWTYQSSVADLSHFGCNNMAGNAGVHCEWGAQYEEYIILFRMRLPFGEVSSSEIEQMETIIKAIDERMALYLEKSVENSED